jgi:hypothetical protein
MHDSEPVWVANPSLHETFIHNTLPALTGALNHELFHELRQIKSEIALTLALSHGMGERIFRSDERQMLFSSYLARLREREG